MVIRTTTIKMTAAPNLDAHSCRARQQANCGGSVLSIARGRRNLPCTAQLTRRLDARDRLLSCFGSRARCRLRQKINSLGFSQKNMAHYPGKASQRKRGVPPPLGGLATCDPRSAKSPVCLRSAGQCQPRARPLVRYGECQCPENAARARPSPSVPGSARRDACLAASRPIGRARGQP
jgi:hypothetical protein